MLLEIYQNVTWLRLDIIRQYEFVQYTEEIAGNGGFTVKVPAVEKSLEYLVKFNLILFEKDVMGVIVNIDKSRDRGEYVTLTGDLVNRFLDYRSFLKTENYTGTIPEIVKKIIDKNFIAPENIKRKMDFIAVEELPSDAEKYTVQFTGKKCSVGIQDILSRKTWGYKLYPVIRPYISDDLGNIAEFRLKLIKPRMLVMGNKDNESPVLFSYRNGNIESIQYSENNSEYANVFIVAGEGEGRNRKIIEIGETDKVGIERVEEYIDARDLQSTDSDGVTVADSKYLEMLQQRGEDKKQEHMQYVSLSGTMVTRNTMFLLHRDYEIGDYVTIIADSMGVAADAQITSVTKSYDKGGEKLDITFGYEKSTVRKILKKEGVL